MQVCSCRPPSSPDQWGCLEDCVNRAVLIECLPGFCPCGDQCANQRIQRGVMPETEIVDCGRKGLGLVTHQLIKTGEFVGEYLGEIVTEQEYHMRRLVRATGVAEWVRMRELTWCALCSFTTTRSTAT